MPTVLVSLSQRMFLASLILISQFAHAQQSVEQEELAEQTAIESIKEVTAKTDAFYASKEIKALYEWNRLQHSFETLQKLRHTSDRVDVELDKFFVSQLSRANTGYYTHGVVGRESIGEMTSPESADERGPKALNQFVFEQLQSRTLSKEGQDMLIQKLDTMIDGQTWWTIGRLNTIRQGLEILGAYDRPEIAKLHAQVNEIPNDVFKDIHYGRDYKSIEHGWLHADEANKLGPIALKEASEQIERARLEMRARFINRMSRDDDANIRAMLADYLKTKPEGEVSYLTKVTFEEILKFGDHRCERTVCFDFEQGTARISYRAVGSDEALKVELPLINLLNPPTDPK